MILNINDIEYKVPTDWSDITVEKNMKLDKLIEGPDYQELQLISLLIECPVNILKALNVKQINAIKSNLGFIHNKCEGDFTLRFNINGIEYGFIDLQNGVSYGEYLDVGTLAKEKDSIHKLLAIMFRPIIDNPPNKNTHIKTNMKFKFPDHTKIVHEEPYTTVSYDDDYDLGYHAENMLQMDWKRVKGNLGFFLTLSQISQIATLPYLESKKKERKMMMEMRDKMVSFLITKDQDGLKQYSVYVKEMLQKYQKS